MFHDADWLLAGSFLFKGEPTEIVEALRDLEACETADLIALHRIEALRGMVMACSVDDSDAELRVARAALEEDLASLEETLPLERAFRADQRDAALARIARAARMAAEARVGRDAASSSNEADVPLVR